MSIKEIAKMAGVSYSTVSRVLNDPAYKCASEQTRQNIMKAARELNYIPNESARNLKLGIKNTQKVYTISILVTRMDSAQVDPFFSEITRITENEIHKNSCILSNVWYKSVFSEENVSSAEYESVIKTMFGKSDENKSDGLIIIGKCPHNAIKVLKSRIKNIVSINRNSTNYETDEVTCDGKDIASKAVEYLISLGHRKIGYVGDCHNEARYKGYRETLFKYNLESDIDFTIETTRGEEQGYRIMERLISQENLPTAIYCANDITAVGMLKCLNKYKNKYYNPSIISSDNIEQSTYTKPMLSTVSLPKNEMARFALFLLLDRIKGGHKAAAKVELEGTLLIRESCSPPENSMKCEYYI